MSNPRPPRPPRIVCAAMKNGHGDIICSPRHYDGLCHQQLRRSTPWFFRSWLFRFFHIRSKRWASCEQGFVDQFGKFYNRNEAWVVAREQNQIIKLCGNQHSLKEDNELFSENLY